jgi:hypothetical protein
MKQHIPFLVLLVLLTACNQDSIFFTISQEVAPLKPRIEGAPTNMVVFERNSTPILYVASGRLHWYARGADDVSSWDSSDYAVPQPGGKIIGLAATRQYLYVLSLSGSGVDTTLQRIDSTGNAWELIPADGGDNTDQYPLHAIYADSDSDTLFAAARQDTSEKNTAYAVFFVKDADTRLRHLQSGIAMLTGVVKSANDYFLSTTGSGIFWIREDRLNADPPAAPGQLEDAAGSTASKDRRFMGMIHMEDNTVIAAERDGTLYKMMNDGSVFKFEALKTSDGTTIVAGNFATGALALWKAGDTKLLLVGVQGALSSSTSSGYTHGYVEFELDSNGAFPPDIVRHSVANKNLFTVSSNDRYAATLGKYPLNHLFQTPSNIDTNLILFAATQKTGLWSYRTRSGEPQWNAEE